MKKSVKGLLVTLIAVLLVVFSFSAYKLYGIVHEYRVAQRAYRNVSGQVVSASEGKGGQQAPAAPGEEGPVVFTEFSPIQVDFGALLGKSADVTGWLYCEDSVINYPVVQGKDNDYYLHRLYDGSYNPSGSLFADYRCARDFAGRYTVIYGHHMNDGSMLASLSKYAKQSYYDEHPVMYLNTPDGNYKVELFSAFVTPANSTVYTLDFADDEAWLAFLNKMKTFSDFESDVELTAQDKVITLSTCTYEYSDARYVVLGKLVPVG